MQELVGLVALDRASPSGLSWAIRPHSRSPFKAGEIALGTVSHGYYRGRIRGKGYQAHRVVWYLTHGYVPGELDHIDGNRLNNVIENLREVTRAENEHNKLKRGYTYNKDKGKYMARIYIEGKPKHLGYFVTPEDAHKAYLDAKKVLHPTAPERCYVKD